MEDHSTNLHGAKSKIEECVDEIPEPIQVLDEILSEFEEPDSLPLIQEQGSPSQGNQSEDDGYMSMNGRRTTKVSTPLQQQIFGPVEECNDNGHCEVEKDETDGFEVPENDYNVAEKKDEGNLQLHCKTNIKSLTSETKFEGKVEAVSNIKINHDKLLNDTSISQTTLPKVRAPSCIPYKYSSLPCSGAQKLSDRGLSSGSFDGERNILGIDISAVHNAVIRGGVARLPATIVNEHPVTIYPGRKSPTRGRLPLRNIPTSLEKHKEVCSNIQLLSKVDSEICSNSTANSPLKRLFTNTQLCILNDDLSVDKQRIFITDSLKNFEKAENNISLKCDSLKKQYNENFTDDDFSDDSLEDQSLPPPAAPPTVPPTPSLSAPVTPRKRSSISWEINMDDFDNAGNNFCSNKHKSNRKSKTDSAVEKKLTKDAVFQSMIEQNSTSVSGSQSSVTTSETGQEQNKSAHQVQVCSTEDEATSIYSDAEDIIPSFPANMIGKGTFIIRKGRNERMQLTELFGSKIMSGHSSFESNSNYNNQSLLTPNSRHSIDLGMSNNSSNSREHVGLSSRSRLSLDLGSPSMEILFQNQNCSDNKSSFTKTSFFDHSSQLLQQPNDFKVEKDLKATKNGSDGCLNNVESSGSIYSPGFYSLSNSNPNVSSSSIIRQQANAEDIHTSNTTTPRRELAPPLEEDEEQYSESQSGCAPLRQIENNISALLRGDMYVARLGDISQQRRSLGFRPGVHKSESAKEMLLSQNAFGPLPPSPTSSSPELVDSDGLPPLPPSPTDIEDNIDSDHITSGMPEVKLHPPISQFGKYDESPQPPTIPPHRSPMPSNTMKARSMDGGYSKKCGKSIGQGRIPGTLPCEMPMFGSKKRNVAGCSRRTPPTPTPREENRLQTSCSLPETPIFARGCDVARTPHRRPTEPPMGSVSRTAPRSSTNVQHMNFGSSIVGIGAGNTLTGCRQRNLSQAFQTGEMLRLTGGPARGWYPKQRSMRPASTENLDHLHRVQQSSSLRAWDGNAGMSGTGNNRKPLTLPPNLTPTFLNKSPREALRRVTSLLIKKGNTKERDSKKCKDAILPQSGGFQGLDSTKGLSKESTSNFNNNLHKSQKKKGFFKNFWKKSKHYSLDQ